MKRKNLERLLITAGLTSVLGSGIGFFYSLSSLKNQSTEVRMVELLEQRFSGDYAAEIYDNLLSDNRVREEYNSRNLHKSLLLAYPIVALVSASVAAHGSDLRIRRKLLSAA